MTKVQEKSFDLVSEVDRKWLNEIRKIIFEAIKKGTPYPQAVTCLRRKMDDLNEQYLVELRQIILGLKN